MATQVKSPNLDPYIYQPDGKGGRYLVTNWVGWCLAYVQNAFNAGWSGSTAWDAWSNRLSYRHGDRNIPSGVYVPIWFDGYGGLGHVAIYKDGKIWSTPLKASSTFVTYNSIDDLVAAYSRIGIKLTYVGWSEDLGGTKLIEGEDMTELIGDGDVKRLRIINSDIKGWDPVAVNAGKMDASELAYWKGKSIREHIDLAVQEGAAYRALKEKQKAFYDTWNAKVAELSARPTKAELEALNASLLKASKKVQETEALLEEERNKPPVIVNQPVEVSLSWRTVQPFLVQEFFKLVRKFRP